MTRFGKYVLHERIAAGGMAEVFAGSMSGDSGFERAVAIKRILPALNQDAEFVRMLVDEAKIAVQLSHSNIAQVLDLGCHEGSYFIAMEFVDGTDFRSILERERTRGRAVPVSIACHVAMKVAEALDHAHRATGKEGEPLGVIHRDISPQNVMLSYEGEVKVVDFGLAKAAGRVTETQSGVVKGKLAYLSPQQALGEPIDHRSDIYSLGLVLYELLTGQRMFDFPSDIDTVLAVQRSEVTPLRQVAPHLPRHLEAIVSRAVERDPDLRYPTAMQLHDDLEVFIYEANELVTRQHVAAYVGALFVTDPSDETAGDDQVQAEEQDEEQDDHSDTEPPPPANDTIPAPPPSHDEGNEDGESAEMLAETAIAGLRDLGADTTRVAFADDETTRVDLTPGESTRVASPHEVEDLVSRTLDED